MCVVAVGVVGELPRVRARSEARLCRRVRVLTPSIGPHADDSRLGLKLLLPIEPFCSVRVGRVWDRGRARRRVDGGGSHDAQRRLAKIVLDVVILLRIHVEINVKLSRGRRRIRAGRLVRRSRVGGGISVLARQVKHRFVTGCWVGAVWATTHVNLCGTAPCVGKVGCAIHVRRPGEAAQVVVHGWLRWDSGRHTRLAWAGNRLVVEHADRRLCGSVRSGQLSTSHLRLVSSTAVPVSSLSTPLNQSMTRRAEGEIH